MSDSTEKIMEQLQGMIRKNINSVSPAELLRLWQRKPHQAAIDDYLYDCEMSHHLWEQVSDRVAQAIDASAAATDKTVLIGRARDYHLERFVQRYREPPCDLLLTGKVTAAQAKVLQELLGLEGNVVQIYKQLNSAERRPVGEGIFPEKYKPLVKKLEAAQIAFELVPIEGKAPRAH